MGDKSFDALGEIDLNLDSSRGDFDCSFFVGNPTDLSMSSIDI